MNLQSLSTQNAPAIPPEEVVLKVPHNNTTALPPCYLNVETVAPVKLDTIVVNNRLGFSPQEIQDRFLKHAGTIVTQEMVSRSSQPEALAKELFTLTSPRECGRVLDLPEVFILDGVPYLANVKGGGVTSYLRNHGSVAGGLNFSELADPRKNILASFPFGNPRFDICGTLGVQTIDSCIEDYDGSNSLWNDLKIDAEKIVLYGRISELVGPSGERVSPQELEKEGYFCDGLSPYLIFRLQKDTLRITDLDLLNKDYDSATVDRVIKERADKWNLWEGRVTSPKTSQEGYIYSLISKLAYTETRMMGAGLEDHNSSWYNVARNTSLAGEVIDAGDIQPIHGNLNRVEKYCRKAQASNIRIIVLILENCADLYEIELNKVASAYVDGMRRGLEENKRFDDFWDPNLFNSTDVQSKVTDLIVRSLQWGARYLPQQSSVTNAPPNVKTIAKELGKAILNKL